MKTKLLSLLLSAALLLALAACSDTSGGDTATPTPACPRSSTRRPGPCGGMGETAAPRLDRMRWGLA